MKTFLINFEFKIVSMEDVEVEFEERIVFNVGNIVKVIQLTYIDSQDNEPYEIGAWFAYQNSFSFYSKDFSTKDLRTMMNEEDYETFKLRLSQITGFMEI